MNDKYLTPAILGNYLLDNYYHLGRNQCNERDGTDPHSSHKAAAPMDRQTLGHGNKRACHLEVGFI